MSNASAIRQRVSTLAFLLPIINNINVGEDTLQAVITAPSRELANQIYKTKF